MCEEALRLSRAKSNINTWKRIRNKSEVIIITITIVERSNNYSDNRAK